MRFPTALSTGRGRRSTGRSTTHAESDYAPLQRDEIVAVELGLNPRSALIRRQPPAGRPPAGNTCGDPFPLIRRELPRGRDQHCVHRAQPPELHADSGHSPPGEPPEHLTRRFTRTNNARSRTLLARPLNGGVMGGLLKTASIPAGSQLDHAFPETDGS